MAILISSRVQEYMPGSFSPEDYIDFYENPFEILDEAAPIWKQSLPPVPWSARNLPNVDTQDLDWRRYKPPSSLRRTADVKSWILQEIVESSINTVEARVAEESREESLKAAEAKAKAAESRKGKEPYLPIIIAEDQPDSESSGEETAREESCPTTTSRPKTILPTTELLLHQEKVEKRRRFAFRRLFVRGSERGESSAAGSVREAALKAQEQQFRQVHETTPQTLDELVECVSCLDDFPSKQVIRVPCHSYCRDCFVRLISAAVRNEQQWPPKCCLNQIPFRLIIKSIPSDLKRTFEDRAQEWEVPIGERVYCSHQNCDLVVLPSRINHEKQRGRCARGHVTCTICRGPRHTGEECPNDPDMNLTNRLAEEEGWRRCYKCRALVEHKEACQHMTCLCGAQFCYVCGQRWRTCSCTMEQLHDIKTAAEARRDMRDFREATEAEELRQILLQIEEAEREEALKAELLRQEQLKLEEERRQREIEERALQESIRRRDIEAKFQGLREALDQLHELQQVLLDMDQEKEAEETIIDIKTTKERLAEKHEKEGAEKEALALFRMAEKESSLEREFQVRASLEFDIEEQFHEQLQVFWKGKKNGDEETKAAMLALRRRMDQDHVAWQEWKKGELAMYQARLDEEQVVREELVYSAKARMEDFCVEREAELVRRMAAEKKWMHEVVVEREKMLAEMEVMEVEGDADSLFVADDVEH